MALNTNGTKKKKQNNESQVQTAAPSLEVTNKAKAIKKQHITSKNANLNVVVPQQKNWYSGSQPTARETVARMYQVANGDKAKFQELETKFNAERSNRGSVIYNPYTSATNYKELEALAAAGIDVSGGITAEWFKENQWLRNHARTNTGYGALAPSSKSSALENAAWAYENLLDAETRTAKAEAELAAMANEAKYWAGLGYSDSEIVKKLKNNSGYGTLWKMDEERQQGGASLLNRAVDYSGEDTMYGMIWAARNEGGSTGNYFTDSVKYTMGQGNRYKADPLSEAARDPSNYEGYHPYILGGTRHDKNQKYGVTSVDRQWLDDHRDWLNDPEKADDWRAYESDVEFTEQADAELNALNQWLDGKIEKLDGSEDSYNDLVDELTALITDGDEITYRDADGKLQSIKLTNLSKMEDMRKNGLAANISHSVDFTLPRYLDKVNDAYDAKVAAMAAPEEVATEKDKGPGFFQKVGDAIDAGLSAAGEWADESRADNQYAKAARTGGRKGDFGADVQGVFDARAGAETTDDVFANYMKREFGIDFSGTLTDEERAIVEKAISTNVEATKRGYTDEERAAAEEAAAAMFGVAQAIAGQPERQKSKEDAYVNSAAYTTVVGASQQREAEADLYARGMVEGDLIPQAHVRDAGVPGGAAPTYESGNVPPVDFNADEWTAMLAGDTSWSGDLFEKALLTSTDPNAVWAELIDGISAQLMGEEGNAISQSWMNEFGGLARNTKAVYYGNKWGDRENSKYDSRAAYGPEIQNALIANEKALDMGAISKQEYITNLVNLSSTAEIVKSAAGGRKITDKRSAEILSSGDGSLGAGVAALEAHCNEKIAAVEQQQADEYAAMRSDIVAARDATNAGSADEGQATLDGVIMSTDVSSIANTDKTYSQYSRYLEARVPGENSYADLQMQAGDPNSPANTIGGYDALYNRGVSALAMEVLDRDMHYAAALGVSLDEYYEEFPELAKSPEQMMAAAQEEFDQKWQEFGNTPEALQMVNEFFGIGKEQADGEDEEETPEYGKFTPIYEDGLTFADIFANATSKFANDFDMNLAKAKHFFSYDLGTENEKLGKLHNKYGTDPAALRDAWDKVLLDEKIPDNVKTEIQAKLDTAGSIYDLGDPDALVSDLDIAEYEQAGKYYDDVIAANGSETEKFVYNVVAAFENMITMIATAQAGATVGVSSYFTSVLSMAPNEYANAYEYTKQTGDVGSALIWATAALGVGAKIEQLQMDNYLAPKASKWDDAILKAKYATAKQGVFKTLFSPDGLQTLVKAAGAAGAKAGINAAGETLEEGSQSLVDSFAKHRALKDKKFLTKEDWKQAGIESFYGGVLGLFASGFTGNVDTAATDYMGTEIASAEAALAPEADGDLINDAIDFESTIAAIQTSGEQLAALQDSSEYKAAQQAEEALKAAEQEVADIDVEIETVTAEQANAVAAVENANAQIQESEACTEEMVSQMEAASKALEDVNSKVAALQDKKAAAEAKRAEAQADYETNRDAVHGMYRQIMDEAKAKAEQAIADKYYNGSTEEQKSASEEYRAACKELAEAKKALEETRAQNRDNLKRGRALLAVDKLTAAVEAAKAKVDEAFANTPEGAEQIAQREELEAATQEAQQTAEDAAANPTDAKKQVAANLSQARLEAIQAKQDMESAKASIRERLNSKNANVRSQAVAEWQKKQQAANAAAQAAQEAEALYNETDVQRELREAIDDAKQYTNEQLLFDDVEGHADAVAAYSRLELARAMAERDAAGDDLASAEIGTPEYDQALANFNQKAEAVEDVIGRQVGTDGDVIRETFRQKSLGTVAMEAIKNGKQDAAARSIKRILDRGLSQAATLMSYSTVAGDNAAIAADLAAQLKDNTGNAVQIAETLNGMEAEMWADHRAAGLTGEQTEAGQNPIEIMRSLTRSIRTGYNPGGNMSIKGKRQNAAVHGMYKAYADAINVRTSSAGDLVVSLHEFGHALGTKLGIHATEDMKNALSEEVKSAYDPSAWDGEAVAEFVVSYMFNRDGAIAKAGADFVSQFENMLAENKRLDKAMSNARAQVELWTNASIRSKAQAQIKSYVARRSQVGSMLYNIVRRVETGIFDLTAPAKIVSKDFHQKALYSMHGAQRSDVLLTQAMVDPNTNETVGVGLAEALYDVGIDEDNISDVLTYQLLKHHLDRLKQDKPVFDVKEFPAEAVEAEIKKMEDENPDLAKMGGAITQWWNGFVDTWLVGTGMVSQEAVDKMRKMYPNYVPTFRVMDVDMSVYGGNSGKFQIRGAVKGGSGLEVVNPLYSIVAQVQKAVKAVTQNQLLQAFDNEYLGNELGEIADDVTDKIVDQSRDVSKAMEYINQLKNSKVADPDLVDNLIKEVNALGDKFVRTGKGVGKYVVGVIRQNGEVAYYSIKDVPLFNLLSGSKATMQEGLGAFKMAKNIITSLTTGSNPLFAFKNAIRDFQASVNTGTWAVTYADGVVKWIRAFAEVVGHSDTFKEWRSLGGGAHLRLNAALDDKSAKQLEKELGKMLLRGKTTRKGEFKISKDAMDVISNVITLKDFNNIIEMTSRFVEYRFGKHDTSTPEGKIEGMMASQDVTTNFGTHGAWGFVNLMAQITPFMNATLQGVHKDMKIVTDLFSKDKATRRQAAPKVAKIVLNSALTAGMQMAILALFKKGDMDDEEYELLSDSMKAGNFIIPIPDEAMDFLRDKFGFNKPYLRLPIAQGGLHQTTYAAALDLIGNTADYSPFDIDLMNTVATILVEAMPNTATVFQSILDARRNKTWYNGNIENTAMQRHSEYNRTDEDVPEVINGVARLFGVSPAKADYVAQQTGGVLYRLGAPLLAGGSLDDRVDAFVTSALNYFAVDPVTTNELSSEFYAAKNIVDQTVSDGNSGLPLGKVAYGADGAAAYREAQYLQKYVFNDAKEALDDLYDRIDSIYADPDIPKGDKEKEVREIRKQMIPIYQAALDEYDPFDSEYIPSNFQLLKRLRDFSKNYSRPTVE